MSNNNYIGFLFIFLFSTVIYCTNRTKNMRVHNLRTKIIKSVQDNNGIRVEKRDKSHKKNILILTKEHKNDASQKIIKEPYQSCCGYNFRDERDYNRHLTSKKHQSNEAILQNAINIGEGIKKMLPLVFSDENITNESIPEIILDPTKRLQLQDYLKSIQLKIG